VFVVLVIQRAKRMFLVYCHLRPVWLYIFFHIFINDMILRGKKTMKCFFFDVELHL